MNWRWRIENKTRNRWS